MTLPCRQPNCANLKHVHGRVCVEYAEQQAVDHLLPTKLAHLSGGSGTDKYYSSLVFLWRPAEVSYQNLY